MKTFSAKPAEVTHEWFVIDATDKVSDVWPVKSHSVCAASTKPFTRLTSIPATSSSSSTPTRSVSPATRPRTRCTTAIRGYPGGITATKFKDMQAKHPGRALEKAVKGMLPKGPLGYAMIKKLKVYAGARTRTPPSSPKCWKSKEPHDR